MHENELQGAVKRVMYDKHFGFLTGDDGKEYFFHASEVAGGQNVFIRLDVGDRVKFFGVENEYEVGSLRRKQLEAEGAPTDQAPDKKRGYKAVRIRPEVRA